MSVNAAAFVIWDILLYKNHEIKGRIKWSARLLFNTTICHCEPNDRSLGDKEKKDKSESFSNLFRVI